MRPVLKPLLAMATGRRILVTPVEQVTILSGAGRGVRLIKPDLPGVLDFFTVSSEDYLLIQNPKGKEEEIAVAQRRVEQAKNALWSAQSQRDAV